MSLEREAGEIEQRLATSFPGYARTASEEAALATRWHLTQGPAPELDIDLDSRLQPRA